MNADTGLFSKCTSYSPSSDDDTELPNSWQPEYHYTPWVLWTCFLDTEGMEEPDKSAFMARRIQDKTFLIQQISIQLALQYWHWFNTLYSLKWGPIISSIHNCVHQSMLLCPIMWKAHISSHTPHAWWPIQTTRAFGDAFIKASILTTLQPPTPFPWDAGSDCSWSFTELWRAV